MKMKKQQKKKKSEGKVVKERDSMDNKEQRVARKDVMMMEEEEAFPRSNSGGLAPIEMKRIRKVSGNPFLGSVAGHTVVVAQTSQSGMNTRTLVKFCIVFDL